MAVNASGVLHHTADDQATDLQQLYDNWTNESWKDWPNEAAVRTQQTLSLAAYISIYPESPPTNT